MRFRGIPVAQTSRGGVLLRNAIGLAGVAVIPFLLAGAFLTSPSATGSRTGAPAADQLSTLPNPPPEPAFSESVSDGLEPDNDPADSAVDVMGNQVTDAVAKYQFDATGSLYELHSPQTELPRLKPPKS
jgi:hypothetical protein